MQPTLKRQHDFITTSLMMFFYSALVSLTVYIDSSFITKQLSTATLPFGINFLDNPESGVGWVYACSAIITLLGLTFAPRLLKLFGLYRIMFVSLVLNFFAFLGLAGFASPTLALACFLISGGMTSIIFFYFDILMESLSSETTTGFVRGIMMTVSSVAWMLPPLISGSLMERAEYSTIYFSAAILIIPVIGLLTAYLHGYPDKVYQTESFRHVASELKSSPDLWHILAISYFLQIFYLWMVIYTPLYLHETLGITGTQFGLIMTIALSAFVIFPYPAGQLADKKYGEKEMLVGGFLLMVLSTISIPFIQSASLALWALVLFTGRTGASIVETMADTYFFKKVDRDNASMVGTYRRMRPLAMLTAPLGSAFLLLIPGFTISTLFLVLAILLLIPIVLVSLLHDTK